MKINHKKSFPIFIIILLLASASGCLEVPVLKVRVNVTTSPDGRPEITDITAEQTTIGVLGRPRDPPPILPGVYCRVMKQAGAYWTIIGFWPSVPYTGAGTYELIVDFDTPPARGEKLKLHVTIHRAQGGDPIASNDAFYDWK